MKWEVDVPRDITIGEKVGEHIQKRTLCAAPGIYGGAFILLEKARQEPDAYLPASVFAVRLKIATSEGRGACTKSATDISYAERMDRRFSCKDEGWTHETAVMVLRETRTADRNDDDVKKACELGRRAAACIQSGWLIKGAGPGDRSQLLLRLAAAVRNSLARRR